ncbi:MAG: DinB family protein [Flavobacterium sp.]|nr:DinB family protein [Flavobacterium sp.]
MLLPSIQNTLNELCNLLEQLTNDDYSEPCLALSSSSIGEHTRHSIEMFQCLEFQYESGVVNYDNRKRDKKIETDTNFAIDALKTVIENLNKPNKKIVLQQIIDGEELNIESNYDRELLYNLEHCIHHQALIKVAVLQNKNINIDADFGVARSTIEYRKQCAH